MICPLFHENVTHGWTDRQMDRSLYRDARTDLNTHLIIFFHGCTMAKLSKVAKRKKKEKFGQLMSPSIVYFTFIHLFHL